MAACVRMPSMVSASACNECLDFGSYQTAWAWLHKLRRTMVRPDRDQLGGRRRICGDRLAHSSAAVQEARTVHAMPTRPRWSSRSSCATPKASDGCGWLTSTAATAKNEIVDFARACRSSRARSCTPTATGSTRTCSAGSRLRHERLVATVPTSSPTELLPGVHRVGIAAETLAHRHLPRRSSHRAPRLLPRTDVVRRRGGPSSCRSAQTNSCERLVS